MNRTCQPESAKPARKPRVVVLSSSLLTDRIAARSGFLERLDAGADVRIWAMSANQALSQQLQGVEPFPKVLPFPEIPHNYLRRLNEYIWDFRLRPPSRISMFRHIRSKTQAAHVRALRLPARALAGLRSERLFESLLERLLLARDRSPEATSRLREARPEVVLATGPHRYEEPAVVAAAKHLRIPTLAFITSFDNLSTKDRPVLRYDGYLVWSEQMRTELLQMYPQSRHVPVYVVGAPQFDAFFNNALVQSREEFCRSEGLNPDRSVIVHALGSPNFLREWHAAAKLAARVSNGDLGDVQMLVRPHPLFENGNELRQLRGFGPRVVVQRTGQAGLPLTSRSQDESQIRQWVNTFRHADVVVNLSSTVTVDAAIFDRPIVNLDFDPEPGQPNQQLVKDVNHLWTHFKPIAESGGVWLTNGLEETVKAVKTYLQHPDLHKEKRRWIAEYVCGYVDGRCGERMAEAVLDFLACWKPRGPATRSA